MNAKSGLDHIAQTRSFRRSLHECAAGFSLRVSARFMHPKFALLRTNYISPTTAIKIKTLCARPVRRGVLPEYDEDGDIPVVKTGTLKNGYLDWSEKQTVDREFYEMVKQRAGVRIGDILVSSTGVGSLGKIDVYDDDGPAIVDGHVAIVRFKNGSIQKEFVAHLMRHRFVQWQIEQELTGATNQIEIYPAQIESLYLPFLSQKVEEQLAAEIEHRTKKIRIARNVLQPPLNVINEILCARFSYPLKEQIERAQQTSFQKPLSSIVSAFTLRNSPKFHHPRFEVTDRFFKKTSHERVKAYLAVPVRLGVTAVKDDFTQDGEAFYVHPGAVKSQRIIDVMHCHRVRRAFFEKNKRRFSLRHGDLVLNRAGEGTIGKSAIFESDEPAIFSDFTMRLRFAPTMNPHFAWYFFRSIIFQSQVEREKRGMGNMTNIFPSQVERLVIPRVSYPEQTKLVGQIENELGKIEKAADTIRTECETISRIVDRAVFSANRIHATA